MTDRAAILSTLESQRAELEARYRAFDAEQLATPCTESEDPDGEPWTPKDHLAHLLRIEHAFLAMAELTVSGDPEPVRIGGPGATWAEKIAKVHRDNEAQVRQLHERSLDELLDELNAARARTIEFIDGISDEQLAMPIPGAPWGDGSIGGVLQANAGHERQHLAWIDAGLTSH